MQEHLSQAHQLAHFDKANYFVLVINVLDQA